MDNFDARPDPDEMPAHRWIRLILLAGVVVIGSGGGYWLYKGVFSASTPNEADLPVIAAPDGEERVRPKDEGGKRIPHQDVVVFQRMGRESEVPEAEEILPGPEEPFVSVLSPRRGPDPDSDPLGALIVQEGLASVTADMVPPSLAEEELLPPPPRARDDGPSIILRAGEVDEDARRLADLPERDEIGAGPDATESPAETGRHPDRYVGSMAGDSAEAPSADISDVAALPPADAIPGDLTTEPDEEADAAPQADTTPSRTERPDGQEDGAWRVQIAAVRDSEAAESEWRRISEEHHDLLRDLRHRVVRADLGDRGVFHRLQVGPLSARDTAAELCRELEAREMSCFVVSP